MSVIRNFLLDNVTPAPVVRENYSNLTLQPEDYERLIYPLVLSTINSSSGLTDIHCGYGELSAKISATSFSLNCNTLFANNGGESPFKLYKFVAFQQQLTEEQLEQVYERYNFYMGN